MLLKEGRVGFYLPNEDNDELSRLFTKRASELNIAPNAKYSAWHGGLQIDFSDADLLAEVARVQKAVYASVSDPNDFETLPHSFSDRFYGRAKVKFHAKDQRNCCKKSESWDGYSCVFNSCPYHAYYPDYNFRSTSCCHPYYGHPSLFCCRGPFYLMYPPYYGVFGGGCCYRNSLSKFKQCPLYYY